MLAPAQRIHVLRAIAVLAGLVIPLLVIGRGAASILVPVIGGLTALALHWPRGPEPLRAALVRQRLDDAIGARRRRKGAGAHNRHTLPGAEFWLRHKHPS